MKIGLILAISILAALCLGPAAVSRHALIIDYSSTLKPQKTAAATRLSPKSQKTED